MQYEVSEHAAAVIQEKAQQLKLTPEQVLDAMIEEFAPTSPADRATWMSTYQLNRGDWTRKHPDILNGTGSLDLVVSKAFFGGYHRGWAAFQTRKSTSMYVRAKAQEAPPELT